MNSSGYWYEWFPEPAELMLNLNKVCWVWTQLHRAVGCLPSAAQVVGLPAKHTAGQTLHNELSPANGIQLTFQCSRKSLYHSLSQKNTAKQELQWALTGGGSTAPSFIEWTEESWDQTEDSEKVRLREAFRLGVPGTDGCSASSSFFKREAKSMPDLRNSE